MQIPLPDRRNTRTPVLDMPASQLHMDKIIGAIRHYFTSPLKWHHAIRLHDLPYTTDIPPNTQKLITKLWNIVRACTIHTIGMNRNKLTFEEDEGSRQPHTILAITVDKIIVHLKYMRQQQPSLLPDLTRLLRTISQQNNAYLTVLTALTNTTTPRVLWT